MEEYLRRKRTMGYEPRLVGMDDEDIEWELSKMDEEERNAKRSVADGVPPVDPGLKARILRMFGQPYDKSAIPRGQEFYLNGWDNGEDDGEDGGPVVKLPDFTARQGGKTRPTFAYNPWAGAWRPDWGPGATRCGRWMKGGGTIWRSPTGEM
jgi:hypothetical protein